jgi:hypothetical protein
MRVSPNYWRRLADEGHAIGKRLQEAAEDERALTVAATACGHWAETVLNMADTIADSIPEKDTCTGCGEEVDPGPCPRCDKEDDQ